MRQHSDDDLGLVAPAVDEQRADRTVDQAGDQRLLFGRTSLALEIAAGNAARGVGLFLIVDGQRQEIDAFARRLGGDTGRSHGPPYVASRRRLLTGDLAVSSLGTSTQSLDGMLMNMWVFHGSRRAAQNTRPCARLRDADRNARSASGDPAMVFIFRMASIPSAVMGILPCPAAGLLLDVCRA